MTDEKTNESNATGEKTTPSITDNKEPLSEFDSLKAKNDEFAKELLRGQELQAEANKLEANKQLAGTTGGRVEPEVKEVSDEDYAKSVMAGNVPDAKE
jgi:hypothetical protein